MAIMCRLQAPKHTKHPWQVPDVGDQRIARRIAQHRMVLQARSSRGYHQIRLAPGEEPKIAFQTHQGHFEYKVTSYGLAWAPGTMNTTLKPLLLICVLVFFDDILVFSKSLGRSCQAFAPSARTPPAGQLESQTEQMHIWATRNLLFRACH